ncbi:hypothetical protein R1sor_023709 [Riccia sorocarpa]|uniref:Uncharacterized protein n=1 Tax=Riccia sorocarpa TaxID=122646 RepID=A0ABD3GP71_9MARC
MLHRRLTRAGRIPLCASPSDGGMFSPPGLSFEFCAHSGARQAPVILRLAPRLASAAPPLIAPAWENGPVNSGQRTFDYEHPTLSTLPINPGTQQPPPTKNPDLWTLPMDPSTRESGPLKPTDRSWRLRPCAYENPISEPYVPTDPGTREPAPAGNLDL